MTKINKLEIVSLNWAKEYMTRNGERFDNMLREAFVAGFRKGVELQKSSAQPGRKTGKWIYMLRDSENDEYRCSVCSNPSGYDYDYCPHCGADMRGEEDG